MRIIAVEEHVINPVIEKATRAVQAAEAGYLANLGARVDNKPPPSADRPYPLLVSGFQPKGIDVDAGRIADMEDVVFTVEYSVRAAERAVYELMSIDRKIPSMTTHAKSLHTQFEALLKACK